MITGITFGSFDLLHAGHSSMLQECKSKCDFLIVGLQTDPTIDRPEKNKPIQTTYERWVQLQSMKAVDLIVPYDTENDLENMLAMLDVQKRFIGSEYRDVEIFGQDICRTRGIQIVYIDRLHNYSSSELRKRITNESYR